jgi:CHRD domain
MRKLVLTAAIGGALVIALGGGSLAFANQDRGGGGTATALIGYNEVPSISTPMEGIFTAEIGADTIRYRLTYTQPEGVTVTQSHIHLGQRHTNGGIAVFLCGGDGKPACPAAGGTVESVIRPVDVRPIAAQGLADDGFDELVRGIRAGATYVNVHSTTFPGGEIRGQLKNTRPAFGRGGRRGPGGGDD